MKLSNIIICGFSILFLKSQKILAQAPVITNVSPNYTGLINTAITISGTGFNPTMANNVVYFGAVRATLTSAAAGALGVQVPAGATYAPITVTDITTNLTGFSPRPFRHLLRLKIVLCRLILKRQSILRQGLTRWPLRWLISTGMEHRISFRRTRQAPLYRFY